MKKVNELLTYAIMLGSLKEARVQYMITLIELQKVLSQELKCLCSNTTTGLSIELYQNYGCEALTLLLHQK